MRGCLPGLPRPARSCPNGQAKADCAQPIVAGPLRYAAFTGIG